MKKVFENMNGYPEWVTTKVIESVQDNGPKILTSTTSSESKTPFHILPYKEKKKNRHCAMLIKILIEHFEKIKTKRQKDSINTALHIS